MDEKGTDRAHFTLLLNVSNMIAIGRTPSEMVFSTYIFYLWTGSCKQIFPPSVALCIYHKCFTVGHSIICFLVHNFLFMKRFCSFSIPNMSGGMSIVLSIDRRIDITRLTLTRAQITVIYSFTWCMSYQIVHSPWNHH